MNVSMQSFRAWWASKPRWYKTVCIVGALFFLLSIFLASPLAADLADMTSANSDKAQYDLAANSIAQGQPIFMLGPWSSLNTYRYSAPYAWLHYLLRFNTTLWILINVVCYVAAVYLLIRAAPRILPRDLAGAFLYWLVPFAVFNSGGAANITYGNIVAQLMLCAVLAGIAFYNKKGWIGGLLLLYPALTKPQWLFPIALPLVLRDWKTFRGTVIGLVAAYIGANAAFIFMNPNGVSYGIDNIRLYGQYLLDAQQNYPWKGQWALTVEHGVLQTLYRLFGIQPWVATLLMAIRLALVGFWIAQLVRLWQRRDSIQSQSYVLSALLLTGETYLIGMLILPEMQELVFGFAPFALIMALATVLHRPTLRKVTLLYAVYAFFGIPTLIGFLLPDPLGTIFAYPYWLPISMLAAVLLAAASYVLIDHLSHQPGESLEMQAISSAP